MLKYLAWQNTLWEPNAVSDTFNACLEGSSAARQHLVNCGGTINVFVGARRKIARLLSSAKPNKSAPFIQIRSSEMTEVIFHPEMMQCSVRDQKKIITKEEFN